MKPWARFTSGAWREFQEAAAFYESAKLGLGSEFEAAVLSTVRKTIASPRAYPFVYKAVRRALVGRFPYAVYYTTEFHSIRVVAVQHLHRDSDLWNRNGELN